ncbi:MlaD family protein [Parapedobacter indicus]|uniref:Phospholipid/cholesterol/gamma-HCH transport system substrate-binding protein n=1 Tax=Parapedobacter indicus TaxID=1477437 RepID=A0A1I3DL15_9SPHI|nr:MlaD family protein [Parapedobacter indicus]PPL04738.1 phospholipid/cholesterol/gamma-HCH transport system substrate-binding protein [Parapedobacter indicus]SFH87420.1 phospholipid/cholesterol/gamma-HCH transport system substrate-binding protein [Parapedobacter indicus]
MSAVDNKRSIIVGLFVLVGIVILVAGILVLGGQQNKFSKTVTVTTVFGDVSGLKAGNNVWFSGVKIGTIKAIRFKNLKEVEIAMVIEESSREYIRKDAVAEIGSESFIGNKLIVIKGGSNDAPAIEDGDVLQAAPTGGMDAMLATLQVNNENLVEITKNFGELSARLVRGEGTIGTLLNDSTLALHVKQMIANLNQTTANTAKASQSLNLLTTKLNQEGTLINDLLTDTVVYANLQSAVAELQGITQTASALMTNLNQTAGKLDQKDNAVGVLLNDPESAETIRQTLINLEQSTEKLDQNMEALQHNFLFRGFFRKQRKEAEKAAKESGQ